jgi:hypothetical protein
MTLSVRIYASGAVTDVQPTANWLRKCCVWFMGRSVALTTDA